MKLVITGGHLTPALALIDYAKAKGDEIIFIGRKHTDFDHQAESREKAEIENRQATFLSLDAVKVDRHRPLAFFLVIPKLVIAFFQSLKLLRHHRPDVVVSFGGYVAVPVALAAFFLRIPIITHEQTHIMGLANQCIALMARRIAVSWEDTTGYLPPAKKVVTGNPIRPELLQTNPQPDFRLSPKPIIYITGGNQGSVAINLVIFELIPSLAADYHCIHQTGNQADFDAANLLRQTLPTSLQDNYTIRTWFSGEQVGWILSHALMVIGRSGANTVTEIIAKQVPAIFIPLPHAAYGEQLINAQMVEGAKAGIILSQVNLNANSLQTAITRCQRDNSKMKANVTALYKRLPLSPEISIYHLVKSAHEYSRQKTI